MKILRGWLGRPSPWSPLLTLSCVLGCASTAVAGPYDRNLELRSPPASIYERTRIFAEGHWPAGCSPEFHSDIDGTNFDVYVLDPSQSQDQNCANDLEPSRWLFDYGLLSAGVYVLTLRLAPSFPPSPQDSVTIGMLEFEVGDPVGVDVFGFTPYRVVCRNRSTGQRVTLPLKRGPMNCESAGLVVHEGDKVTVRARGKVSPSGVGNVQEGP